MFTYIMIGVAVALLLMLGRRLAANRKTSAHNVRMGHEFLKANSQQPGVQKEGSGLQHQVLEQGSGSQHPTQSDRVKVHYHGTLLDGTVFDSSVERGEPITFGLNQVIPGWTEGLQLMVTGQKMRLFIPSELGYGRRAVSGIPAGSLLIFDVELLAINE